MGRFIGCALLCAGMLARAFGQAPVIVTVAGNGTAGISGDGGPATAASLNLGAFGDLLPGITVDSSGNFFFVDYGGNAVRKVSNGIISSVIAPAAHIFSAGVAIDPAGNLIVTDYMGARILRISKDGTTTTIAGNGNPGFSGDGGPALSASMSAPGGIAVDASGNLFFADLGNNRIRTVSPTGIISTIAGNGTIGYSGDGGPGMSASLNFNSIVAGVAVDGAGNVFFADGANNVVRKISSSGIISTVAGNGVAGFLGDGGPAISAELDEPIGVAVDSAGTLFIADFENERIREVSADGTITTFAGSGPPTSCGNFSGDGGPPASATLCGPTGIALDASGNLYIADADNNRIREVLAAHAAAPAVTAVVNGASFVGGGVVPGELATVFGTNLTSSAGINVTSGLPLPATFETDQLLVNNKPAPIFAVDNVNGQQQINFQVPWEVAGRQDAMIAASNNGTTGTAISVPVRAAQPGIFSYTSNGMTFGAILHSNYQLADSASPVKPGETVLIFCTGLGDVISPPEDGAAGNGQPTRVRPTVTIGGKAGLVSFSGLAPGFVGLYQINAEIPDGVKSGDISVVVSVASVLSNSVLLPVQ